MLPRAYAVAHMSPRGVEQYSARRGAFALARRLVIITGSGVNSSRKRGYFFPNVFLAVFTRI